MKKEIIENSKIQINGIEIPYIINYGKRKNMYICVKQCQVTVKVPFTMPEAKVEKFIQTKIEWIYGCFQKQKANEVKYQDGETIKILGQKYMIKIENIEKKRSEISVENKQVIIKINKELENEQEIKKQIEKLYYSIAYDEIEAAMQEITAQVGLRPNEYRIKKLKRAWGNCSSSKKISINLDVVQFSREFIKYVVLHEICHLIYMNHSREFWNMVESYMPNYKNIKKECKIS